MAGNNGNQANNQRAPRNAQAYSEKLQVFANKISELNVEDLDNYVVNGSGARREKNTFIEDSIKEYKELLAINKDNNGNIINKDAQLSVFEMAAEKLGPAFWENFEVTETVVHHYLVQANDLINNNADQKEVEASLKGMLQAISYCPEDLKKTYSEDFETLYTLAVNQYGAGVVKDLDHDIGVGADVMAKSSKRITTQDGSVIAPSLPTEMRFHIQMHSWERINEQAKQNDGHFDSEDFDRVKIVYQEARKLAKDENGQPYDKDRFMKAFEESAFIFGEPFWGLGAAIPMSIPEKYIRELGEKMEKLNSGEPMSLENEKDLARFFRTTIMAVHRGEQKPTPETKELLNGYYLTIQQKLQPAAAEKVYGSTSFDKVFPEYKAIAEETRARIEGKVKNEQRLAQEQEENRKGLLFNLCKANTLSDHVNSLLDDEINPPEKEVFSKEDHSILIEMREDAKSLGNCFLKEKSNILPTYQSTFENIQTKYPGYIDWFHEKLQNAEPGSNAYKTTFQALIYCGAMLSVTQQYVKARHDSGLFPEDQGVAICDAAVSVRKMLSVFKEAFQAFPQSGSSKIFSELKNSIDQAINGEGTLQDVLDKAKAYHEARKGILFSPFTDVGKHRLDMADKLIFFIEKFDVAAMDKTMAESKVVENENVVANANVAANANANAPVQENAVPVVPAQEKETPGSEEYVKIEENAEENEVEEENLINNGENEVDEVEEENLINNGDANAKVEEQPGNVSNAEKNASLAEDELYDKIQEKCTALRDRLPNGQKGLAGTLAELAYNSTYEEKENLLNNLLNDEGKLNNLLKENPVSRDFEAAVCRFLNKEAPVHEQFDFELNVKESIPEAKAQLPKEPQKPSACNLNDKVYQDVHEKCIHLTKDLGIITFDQAAAIDAKADAGNFAQKEYLNKFLDNTEMVKALAQQFPKRENFENALDGVLEKVNQPIEQEQNEFSLLDKQNEYYSLDNQSEMEKNEFNLLDPEDGPENNEMQPAEKSDYNLM